MPSDHAEKDVVSMVSAFNFQGCISNVTEIVPHASVGNDCSVEESVGVVISVVSGEVSGMMAGMMSCISGAAVLS